ncbi:MAG TPA: hypothetical protein VK152_06870 [Paludibacter sp.]|nr:hypothetical protein [Paludibacter sp.]
MDYADIIKLVLPALLVMLTAYLLLNKLLRNEERRQNFELRKNSQPVVTPVRLRAYERLTLVLERTMPSTLILHVAKPAMTNMELQTELLATIRQEFGHNLSQQIYVSNEVWSLVRSTQESLLRLVNTCAAQCKPNESASALAELIIKVYGSSDRTPGELALEKLKNEVRTFFQ